MTDSCIGCGVCVDRCQMDALEMGEDHVLLSEKKLYRLRFVCHDLPHGFSNLAEETRIIAD